MLIPLHRLLGRLLPIPLAAALLLSVPAVPGAASAGFSGPESAVPAAVQGASRETAADYALFLKDKFGIAFSETPAKGEFLAATAAALRLVSEDAEASAADGDAVFPDVTASSPYYDAAIDIAAAYRTDEPGIAYARSTFWANAAFCRYLKGEAK
jgi:hypothetical protein